MPVITDPDWIDPIDTTFDVEKPIRSEQGLLLAGNPIAMALGKSSAPYMQSAWHPYNGSNVGDGITGEIWSFASDGPVSAIETPVFADGYEYKILAYELSTTTFSGSASIQVRVRRDVDDGYQVVSSFALSSGSDIISFGYWLDQPRRVVRIHVGPSGSIVDIGASSAVKSFRVDLSAGGINFDAGAVYLYKRLSYA